MSDKTKTICRAFWFLFYVVTTFIIILLLWQNYDHHRQAYEAHVATVNDNTIMASNTAKVALQNQRLLAELVREMDKIRVIADQRLELQQRILELMEKHANK